MARHLRKCGRRAFDVGHLLDARFHLGAAGAGSNGEWAAWGVLIRGGQVSPRG